MKTVAENQSVYLETSASKKGKKLFSISKVNWIQWSVELIKDIKLEKSMLEETRMKVSSTYPWRVFLQNTEYIYH